MGAAGSGNSPRMDCPQPASTGKTAANTAIPRNLLHCSDIGTKLEWQEARKWFDDGACWVNTVILAGAKRPSGNNHGQSQLCSPNSDFGWLTGRLPATVYPHWGMIMGHMGKSPADITTPYRIENPEEFAQNMLRLFEVGGKVMSGMIERSDSKVSPYSAASEMQEAVQTVSDVARVWMTDPAKLAEAQGMLVRSYVELWNSSLRRMMGEDVQPVAVPEPSDNRFKDPEWSSNPFFDFWKQAYLVTTHWAEGILKETDGLDDLTRQKAEFYFRQISSAMSPSNMPMLNPEVVRETFATNGRNLVQGMTHLVDDMSRSGDLLKISQTDTQAFEVGKNLAMTPGKIVYQNDLLQLIQYSPTTDKVRELPLLVVPPWINKYYILDLTPAKSFVKFAVDQGFTVFLVSWVNPDAKLAHKSFEDYMTEGLLSAAA